ncbi:hypothetical protein [Streptomyces sp. NPDC050856]|uniref:hypothetical protein n=1 Tax=Streptomyces sp. NPDC050856 TaxID=3154939 RepID=UPI0033CF24D3
MTWDQWTQIKTEATARQEAQTRLNQVAPAGGGGTTPDLAASTARKQAAAKAIGEDLEPGVRRDGEHAAESTRTAVKEFGPRDGYGWDTSNALKKAQETWQKQVMTLLGRLAAERGLLTRTAVEFGNIELDIAARMARESRINSA